MADTGAEDAGGDTMQANADTGAAVQAKAGVPADGQPLMNAAVLDRLVDDGFSVHGQLALYKTCVKQAFTIITEIKAAVDAMEPGTPLGPGAHDIPFKVREVLLLCFSCLDSSIHQLARAQNALFILDGRKFMSLCDRDFTQLGAQLGAQLARRHAAVANHHALNSNGEQVFKTNQLWNTLKHYGMPTMSVARNRATKQKMLHLNGAVADSVNMVTYLRGFCDTVNAWVEELIRILTKP